MRESDTLARLPDPTGLYIEEAGHLNRITPKEEIILGQKIQQAQHILHTPTSDRLSPEQERILAEGRVAAKELAEANLRLVIAIAKRFSYGDLSLLDRIQEGNIGLLKAVLRFNPDRGVKFATYASWWIKQAMIRAAIDTGDTIRRPYYYHEIIQKIIKISADLQEQLQRNPTDEEIAEHILVGPKQHPLTLTQLRLIRQLHDRNSHLVRLDHPTTAQEDDDCLIDHIPDHHSLSPEETFLHHEKQAVLKQALAGLSPKERYIVKKYYSDGEGNTLESIGREFGLSRERIRQIIKGAKEKMAPFCQNFMLS